LALRAQKDAHPGGSKRFFLGALAPASSSARTVHHQAREKYETRFTEHIIGRRTERYLHAEKQLLKALPKMAKAASSEELRSALTEHLGVTRRQIERLEDVFESLGKTAKAKTCKAMQGLVEEATEIMEEDGDDAVLDAGIIAAAQKVEHYEMASYGTVRTWARLCGQTEAAELLQETLDEEGEADKRLTQLAESFVNPEAESGGGASSSASKKGGSKSSSSKKSSSKSRR
jgi:ferritin-like metal-binding protein YciE